MGRIMRGLTFGGIVGFVLGLLFAPQKGEKTRKQLHDSLEEGKKKITELKDEIKTEEEGAEDSSTD
jgi:gas vesicle protein